MPDYLVVSEPALRPLPQRLRAWLAGQIETLYPGSFALVMATGIISNALFFDTRRAMSDALFATSLVAYSLLVIFLVLRTLWFRRALWADLINPRLVFSFFRSLRGPTSSASASIYGASSRLRRRYGSSR
jgi:tellurite resistance protein TehA-like permease